MKKKLSMLTLTIIVAAAVLLFVGCPTEPGGGTRPYEGEWEHVDGSMREVFIFTSNTWEVQSQELIASSWVILWKTKGTMSATPNTFTMTITHQSAPYYGYPMWYDSSSWDYYDPNYRYYLSEVYYSWSYYVGGYQAATLNVPYSLSGDGNTLILSTPSGPYSLTRI